MRRGIAHDETDLRREFPPPGGGDCGTSFMGGGEVSRAGNPHRGYRRDQEPLPAVDPTMPAGRGPMGFGIDGRMRDKAVLPILLVPHSIVGPQRGTIDGRSPTPCGPGRKEGDQVTSHTTNVCWQGAGYGRQAPLPRPPRGMAAMLQQQGASGVHLRGAWSCTVHNSCTRCQCRPIMMLNAFKNTRAEEHLGRPRPCCGGGGGRGIRSTSLTQVTRSESRVTIEVTAVLRVGEPFMRRRWPRLGQAERGFFCMTKPQLIVKRQVLFP